MNDTDTTGTAGATGEDRFLQLLDDEGARFRAGYEPPSFDEAVRRLALPGDEGARLDGPHEAPPASPPRVDWWRPALIAAAVLVLVGGVTGAVSATLHRPAPNGAAEAVGSYSPRLTGLPSGFVERSGPDPSAPSPVTAPGADGRDPVPTLSRTWQRGASDTSRTRGERVTLDVYDGTFSDAEVPFEVAVVRGHLALVDAISLTSLPGVLEVSVRWAEDADHWVQVSYENRDITGSGPERLDVADVVALARTYETGTSSSAAAPFSFAPLPDRFPSGAPGGLRLWQRAAVARVTPSAGGRALTVTLPAAQQSVRTHCSPLAVASITGSTSTAVTVSVGLYVQQLPTALYPCPAQVLPNRTQTVDLGGLLGGRAVVDGDTGRVLISGQ